MAAQNGNLGIYSGWSPGDNGWGPAMDWHLNALDALVQPVVVNTITTTPPSSPTNGAAYIIAAGASGAWSGKVGQIAVWQQGAWQYYTPKAGWSVFDNGAGVVWNYNGAGWASPLVTTPERWGVVPSNTSAGQNITNAFAYHRANFGGGIMELAPGATYNMTQLAAQTVGSSYVHTSWGGILQPPSVMLRGNGATLKATSNAACGVDARGDTIFSGVVTGAMTVGANVFQLATVADAANYSVGDWVLWRLGDLSYDTPETVNWGFAKVTVVNTGTGQVTIDANLRRAWDGTGTNNKHLHKVVPLTGKTLDGCLRFDPPSSSTGTQGGFSATVGVGITLDHVIGRGCYAGTFDAQYVQDFHIGTVEARENPYTSANQGQGSRFAEATGRIDKLHTIGCAKEGLLAEAACDISIGYHRDDNSFAATTRSVVLANGESRIHIENGYYTGLGGHYVLNTINGGRVTWGRLRCEFSTDPYTLPMPGEQVQMLELRINGVEERYDASRAYWYEQLVELTDNMNLQVNGPTGCVAQAYILFGGGAVQGDFSSLYVGRNGDATNIYSIIPTSASTTEVSLTTVYNFPGWGSVTGNKAWQYRAAQVVASIQTPAGTALAGSGKYVRVRWLIVPNELASAKDSFTSADLQRTKQGIVIEGSAASTLNVSIAAGGNATQSIPATGTAYGDLADVAFSYTLPTGLIRQVEAGTNLVKVTLYNPTAAAITGPTGTVYVQSRKRRLGA
jgi:hypothetical protein